MFRGYPGKTVVQVDTNYLATPGSARRFADEMNRANTARRLRESREHDERLAELNRQAEVAKRFGRSDDAGRGARPVASASPVAPTLASIARRVYQQPASASSHGQPPAGATLVQSSARGAR